MQGLTVRRRWWAACLLSVVMPGMGQLYNGEPVKAAAFYVIPYIAYLASVLYFISSPSLTSLVYIPASAVASVLFIAGEAAVRSRRIGSGYTPRPYNRWYVYLMIFIAMSAVSASYRYVVGNYVADTYRIPSASSEPSILAGEWVITDSSYRCGNGVERGDIIIFRYPDDERLTYIKRVVGMPGETVEIRDKVVYIDGEELYEDYTKFTDPEIRPGMKSPRDNFGSITVPDDSYFVLGDNRDNSVDSRYFGFVKKELVRGRVAGVYLSVDPESYMVRWDRFGVPL